MWPFFAPNLTILTWPSLVSLTHAAAHWSQRRFHRLPELMDSGIPRNYMVCPISILYPRGSFHLGCHSCKFILGAVYIHLNVLQESIQYFMFQMLGAYSEAIRLIFLSMNPDTETPILLCGDFNTDVVCKLYEIQVQFGLQEFSVHNSGQYMHRSNIH
jgi:endonuclease/exonuclease/phosphatase family metal-dependent hydrolase